MSAPSPRVTASASVEHHLEQRRAGAPARPSAEADARLLAAHDALDLLGQHVHERRRQHRLADDEEQQRRRSASTGQHDPEQHRRPAQSRQPGAEAIADQRAPAPGRADRQRQVQQERQRRNTPRAACRATKSAPRKGATNPRTSPTEAALPTRVRFSTQPFPRATENEARRSLNVHREHRFQHRSVNVATSRRSRARPPTPVPARSARSGQRHQRPADGRRGGDRRPGRTGPGRRGPPGQADVVSGIAGTPGGAGGGVAGAAAAPGAPGSEMSAMHAMQTESQLFNLQMLALQEKVGQENRRSPPSRPWPRQGRHRAVADQQDRLSPNSRRHARVVATGDDHDEDQRRDQAAAGTDGGRLGDVESNDRGQGLREQAGQDRRHRSRRPRRRQAPAPSASRQGFAGRRHRRRRSKAGKITAEAAVDQVVDRVLDNQLGADAPPKLRSQVETRHARRHRDRPGAAAPRSRASQLRHDLSDRRVRDRLAAGGCTARPGCRVGLGAGEGEHLLRLGRKLEGLGVEAGQGVGQDRRRARRAVVFLSIMTHHSPRTLHRPPPPVDAAGGRALRSGPCTPSCAGGASRGPRSAARVSYGGRCLLCAPGGPSGVTGSVTRKVVPLPGRL